MKAFEKQLLLKALQNTTNHTKAAEYIGLKRTTFLKKIKEHHLNDYFSGATLIEKAKKELSEC